MQAKRKGKILTVLLALLLSLIIFAPFALNLAYADETPEETVSVPEMKCLDSILATDDGYLVFPFVFKPAEQELFNEKNSTWVFMTSCNILADNGTYDVEKSGFRFVHYDKNGEITGYSYKTFDTGYHYEYFSEEYGVLFVYVKMLIYSAEVTVSVKFDMYAGTIQGPSATVGPLTYNSVRNNVALLEERINFLEMQLAGANEQNTALDNELSETLSALKDARKQYYELKELYENSFSNLLEYRKKIESLEKEIEQLKTAQGGETESGCSSTLSATFIPAAVAVLVAGAVIGGKRYGKKTK